MYVPKKKHTRESAVDPEDIFMIRKRHHGPSVIVRSQEVEIEWRALSQLLAKWINTPGSNYGI